MDFGMPQNTKSAFFNIVKKPLTPQQDNRATRQQDNKTTILQENNTRGQSDNRAQMCVKNQRALSPLEFCLEGGTSCQGAATPCQVGFLSFYVFSHHYFVFVFVFAYFVLMS